MLDLFILVIIGWSLYNGWRAGLVREILSTAGILVGLFGASLAYTVFGETLAVATGRQVNMVTNIVAFFLLWIIIPLALGFAATLLTRVLRTLQLGSINAAAGAGLSLIKYVILLSCLLTAMHSLGILNE
ncbi:MAG: CvpA family protein, partial [Alloprevotella sp.]|nr:CvpA family protein [Alloprevotella sp.]